MWLGLLYAIIPAGMSADKAHRFVPPLIAEGRCYPLHVNLIAHGRDTCHPRNPECARCPLKRHCPFGSAESVRRSNGSAHRWGEG